MYKKEIKLSQETVREFVNAVSKCDFDVDLGYNNIVVDAKSIMGVFSLDLSNKLTVSYNQMDDKLELALNRFALN